MHFWKAVTAHACTSTVTDFPRSVHCIQEVSHQNAAFLKCILCHTRLIVQKSTPVDCSQLETNKDNLLMTFFHCSSGIIRLLTAKAIPPFWEKIKENFSKTCNQIKRFFFPE
ncbi:gamma-aminobutyric acid receptor subunit alpha-1 [Platysternon megacephalum]|uniref:Gamma-aminobutyric acid receptor subunit alpha-1 n=1 Tax=Platysternon megacephalum TaxID=55544 RepID=A0A4D9EJC3_9SAUR|nr:gamma-aminobutyric acid receptor subunit alpha-1 [Platysternon megacephalum]